MAKAIAGYNPNMPVREVVASGEEIHEDDCDMTRKFLRRMERGRYGTNQRAILAAAKRELGPKATILENILAFLEKIIPIIMPFILKAKRRPSGRG